MIRTALTAAVVLALCTAGTAAAAAPHPAHRHPAHATGPHHPAHATAHATAPRHADLLRVTYDNGNGVVVSRLLWCHPAGGSMPGAADACRRLDALGGPLGAAPRHEMCSMVYGGPQTARVTGMWRGRRVDERYGRADGCQTSRWRRMEPVLPPTAAPGTGRSARR